MSLREGGAEVPAIGGHSTVTPALARSLCQVSTSSSRERRNTPHPSLRTKEDQRW